MHMIRFALVVVVGIVLVGCESKSDVNATNVSSTGVNAASETGGDIPQPGEGEAEGLDIKLPGVDISIGKGKGVNVKAPGVDVSANRESGVQVTTPETNLRVNREDGLQLNAPETSVRVNEKDGVNVKTPTVDIQSKP